MITRARIAPMPTPPPIAAALLAAMLAAGACVTNEVDPTSPEAVGRSVIIPFETQVGDGPVDAYYKSIMGQMHEAYLERNSDLLAALLEKHDGPKAPSWASEVLPRYRSLLKGLRFEEYVGRESRLGLREAEVEAFLGEPLEMVLEVPVPRAELAAVTLGAEDDEHPTAFRVTFEIEDQDSRGDVIRRQSSDILRLPDEAVLEGDNSLELSFSLEQSAGAALIRTVTAHVELMPGYVRVDGDQVPHNRVACARTEVTLYPDGVAPIRRAPRITLQRAMEFADADHFPHVFLAAHFMSEPYVEEAMTALMGWVRMGNEGQQQVAMAAMSMLTDANIKVGDRRRWLEWWQNRKR